MDTLRCVITGNLCGTDTWKDGCPCLCENCKRWLTENQKDMPHEFNKIIDENFFDLI